MTAASATAPRFPVGTQVRPVGYPVGTVEQSWFVSVPRGQLLPHFEYAVVCETGARYRFMESFLQPVETQ
jgi:hypothetical protein